MAYYLTYKCQAYNRLGQYIEIEFERKDVFADSYSLLPLREFNVEYPSGEQDKFTPTRIASRAFIKIRARAGTGSTINAEMFYSNEYDDWRVTCKIDTVNVFKGFIALDVEPYVLKDKPYDVVITATDGIPYLDKEDLTDVDGLKFNGRNTLISYLAGALKKTNLDLNIRICVNIYNTLNDDRLDFGSPDMFSQNTQHHKTYEKDVNSFYTCGETIDRMIKGWGIIYQYMGMWVISNRAELQYSAGPDQYYSDYDSDGNFLEAAQDINGIQIIGKLQNIHATNLDQWISYQPAVKSVVTRFKYKIPPNLVNNQRLQNLGDFIAPLSGVGYSAYELTGWSAYQGEPNTLAAYAGASSTYIKTEFDSYGVETDRYYFVEADPALTNALELQIRNDNDDFFADKGDKLTISITSRLNADQSGSDPIFLGRVALLKSGTSGSSSGDWYSLNPGGNWVNNPFANFAQTNESIDTSQWVTYTTEADVFPGDGNIYLFLGSGGVDGGGAAHHKDISINVTLYVKGSRLDVEGDYWTTSQNLTIKDTIDEEIFISDAPKRILPGALWNEAGTALTDPDWYRLGETENLHFKELVNLARYRHQFHRNKRIEGEFKGVMCMPSSNPTIQLPLSFHRGFQVENISASLVLVPPLQINYIEGIWRGTLIESFASGDAAETGDTHTFNYEFK